MCIDGETRHLSPKAIEVLLLLAQYANQTLRVESIVAAVWQGGEASRNNLSHLVGEIRHALGDQTHHSTFIQTLPGKGYRLIAQVEPLDEQPAVLKASKPAVSSPDSTDHEHNPHAGLSFDLLRNSKLLKVSFTFVVSTWVALQVFQVLFPVFNIPAWGLKIVVLVLVIGLPLILLFYWLKEIKIRNALYQGMEGTAKAIFFKQLALDFSIIGSLSVIMGFVAMYLVEAINQEQDIQLALLEPPGFGVVVKNDLVAVLPIKFTKKNHIPDYFEQTFQGELIHSLSRQQAFGIVSQRATNELPSNSALADYASRLGARYVLDGQVVDAVNSFTVMVSLIDTETGLQLWSASVQGDASDLLAVQQAVNRQSINALSLVVNAQLDGQNQEIGTEDFKAYDSYIQGRQELSNAETEQALAQAERHFLESLNADPNFSQATQGLCQTYLASYQLTLNLSSFQSAQLQCNLLLQSAQLKAEGFVALGDLNRISGKYQAAIDYYAQALHQNSKDVLAISGTALCYAELNDLKNAEQLLAKTVELEPGYWKNYLTLGDFYFYNGRYKESSEQYAKVTLLSENSEQGFNRLGASYYMNDQLDKASAAWQKSSSIQPSANNYSNLATALFFQQQFDKAEDSYQKAVDLKPADPVLWANLGDAQKFAGHINDAEKSYQHALRLAHSQLSVNAQDIVMQAMMARYRSELGNCDDAVPMLAGVDDGSIVDPYIFYDLAVMALNCGSESLALEHLNQAIALGYPVSLAARDIQFSKIFNKQKEKDNG